MPTYDYTCRNCGTTIEVIHGMTEEGPASCEVCSGPMRRVLFAAGIIFKGSGFYRNDSRNDRSSTGSSSSKAPAAASSSASASASDASASGGTDGTPTKTDTGGSGGSAPAPSPATD